MRIKSLFNRGLKRLTITGLAVLLAVSTSLLVSNPALLTQIRPHDDKYWSFESIAAHLGAPRPRGVIDIENNSERGRNAFIDLRFSASPDNVLLFTNYLCRGVLYTGYDPFDAINTIEPASNAHLIKMRNFTYYSYSTNTSEDILGNRCWDDRIGTTQIRVDASDPRLYKVRLETIRDPSQCQVVPCQMLGVNFVQPIPDGFPLMVVGLHETDEEYIALSDEICVETQDYYDLYEIGWVGHENWQFLIGSTIEIHVDDQPVLEAFVHEYGFLLPREGIGNWYPSYYNSCFHQIYSSGNHTVQMTITTPEMQQKVYQWSFLVLESS